MTGILIDDPTGGVDGANYERWKRMWTTFRRQTDPKLFVLELPVSK